MPRKHSRSKRLRLVYAGRLVQYQKRILDYIDLATALDRTGVPYTISLIGRFVPHEKATEDTQLPPARIRRSSLPDTTSQRRMVVS